MPTFEKSVRRLALNQSATVGTKEVLADAKLTLFQGLGAKIQCALFNDTPEASSLVTNISNIDSVHLIVRKHNPNGGILFTKEVTSGEMNPSLTYAAWVATTAQHFTFELTTEDTTQIVPNSGRLPIYFVVTLTADESSDFVGGFGYGEIVNAGYIENPVSEDYETGRTPIVGGQLLSDLDLNGFKLINSGDQYTEEGYVALTNAVTKTVPFTFVKPDIEYRFDYLYVLDNLGDPVDRIPTVRQQTTDYFVVGFAGGASAAGTTLYWRVVPKVILPNPDPAPRFVSDLGLLHLTGDEEAQGFKNFTDGISAPFIRGHGINVKDTAFAGGAKGDNVTDDGPALVEAFAAQLDASQKLYIPPGIYFTNQQIPIPGSMYKATIEGCGVGSRIKAGPSFPTDQAIFKGDLPGLSMLTLEKFCVDLNGRAACGIDFTRVPESSIQHFFSDLQIENMPDNSTGIILDGCEDTTLFRVKFFELGGTTGVRSVQWACPGGNISFLECNSFNHIRVEGQIVTIRGGVMGPVIAMGPILTLLLSGVYQYCDAGSVKANFYTETLGSFRSVKLQSCYVLCNGQTGATAFKGKYYCDVKCENTIFLGQGLDYTVIGPETVIPGGFHPHFNVDERHFLDGTTIGTAPTGATHNIWRNATLQNSWVGISGFAVPGFLKDENRFVVLRGAVQDGITTQNTILFVLPEGYRPESNVTFAVQSGSGVSAVTVDNSGNVLLTFASNATISLSGVRFQTALL